MILQEAKSLLHSGQFEEGVELINEHLQEHSHPEETVAQLELIMARMYYHLGRLDQAEYYAKQSLSRDESNDLARIMTIIYQFEQGDHLRTKVAAREIAHWLDLELEASDFNRVAWYQYYLGSVEEFGGSLMAAKDHYTESLELLEGLGDAFEAQLIRFKLATVSRKLGRIEEATVHLRQSLSIATDLGLTRNQATSATLLGQDRLMSTEYNLAKQYLIDGVRYWKEDGSPFGTAWALGELAVVEYLSGNYEAAIEFYTELIQLVRGMMPPIHLSNHYLNLIRFHLSAGELDEADQLSKELETMRGDNKVIEQRARLAHSLIELESERLSRALLVKNELEELEESLDIEVRLLATLGGLKLLVRELEHTQSQVVGREIEGEIDEQLEAVLNYIRMQQGITYELHSHQLRQSIDVLDLDPLHIRSSLDNLNKGVEQKGPWELSGLVEKIPTDGKLVPESFKFNKEFHSVPSLKIMLYLLPRTWVSFSELQNGTALSAGHLSGKTSKLEEIGYLISEKRFVEEKPTTLFSLTVSGFKEFKDYMAELKKIIDF